MGSIAKEKRVKFFCHVRRLMRLLAERFSSDNIMRMSASLSFSTLLTLVPFFILSVYVLSSLPFFDKSAGSVQQFVLDNFVVSTASNLNKQISVFVNQIGVLKWTNIVVISIVSVMMMMNMVDSYNDIWGVKNRYHFAWTLLIYWILVLLMPVAFACILMIGPYFFSIHFFYGIKFYQEISHFLLRLLPFLSSVVVFTFCNWLLPSTTVKFKYALFAGFVSAVLFLLAKFGFSFYLQFFRSYRLIYGALAAIPFFLIWVYISWIIVLMGAQVCHILSVGLEDSVVFQSGKE